MSLKILRGQTVSWPISATAGGQPVDMTELTWSVIETTFLIPPTLENGEVPRLRWTSEQTKAMKTGKKKLRLGFTQPNGDTRALPDMWIQVA